MDALDRRIVKTLQKRGDLTQAELADVVKSTPSTCLRRVHALRASGVLTRNVYLADASSLGRGIKAIITVTTRDHPRSAREKFAARLRREGAISDAFGVTGEVDAVLIANFRSMEEYQAMCDRLFDGVETVVRYTTHFATETYKTNADIPVS